MSPRLPNRPELREPTHQPSLDTRPLFERLSSPFRPRRVTPPRHREHLAEHQVGRRSSRSRRLHTAPSAESAPTGHGARQGRIVNGTLNVDEARLTASV